MKIIITIYGGLVEWVQTDAKEPVEIMIRDLDTEGADDFEITKEMKDENGDEFLCEACIRMENLEPDDAEQRNNFQKIWNHFKPKE